MAKYLSFDGINDTIDLSPPKLIEPNWYASLEVAVYEETLDTEVAFISDANRSTHEITYRKTVDSEIVKIGIGTIIREFTFPFSNNIDGLALVELGVKFNIDLKIDLTEGFFRCYIGTTEASNTYPSGALIRFRDFNIMGRSGGPALEAVYSRMAFYRLQVWSDAEQLVKAVDYNANSTSSNGTGVFLYDDVSGDSYTNTSLSTFPVWMDTSPVPVEDTTINMEIPSLSIKIMQSFVGDPPAGIDVSLTLPNNVSANSTTTLTATVTGMNETTTLNLSDNAEFTAVRAIPYELKLKMKNGDVLVKAACQNSFGDYVVLDEADDWARDVNGNLLFNPDNTIQLTSVPTSSTYLTTKEDAYTFLSRASFGGTQEEINTLVETDVTDWVEKQLEKPYESYVEALRPEFEVKGNSHIGSVMSSDLTVVRFWDGAIDTEGNGFKDVLRQRLIYALSQIIVANDPNKSRSHREAYYIDQLGKNAFGNYRDILYDITYTPLMGEYLTFIGNRKFNPLTGASPDENYAREILQLFSVGLVELNMDGTPVFDVNGQPIETYRNLDIENLAKVFTGFRFDFSLPNVEPYLNPMEMNEAQHSLEEKAFLDVVIPANTNGFDSVNLAIDGIFNHPNVPPFIARQLIQRFTASHPEPAYVERVATAFATGTFTAGNGKVFGTGQRGCMKATISSILLDESLYTANVSTTSYGKIKEPVLKFIHLCRAIGVKNVKSFHEGQIRNQIFSDLTGIGQKPFDSPSVFNYYRPDFVAPSTESALQNLTTPELQILDSNTTIAYVNFITQYIKDTSPPFNGEEGVNYFEPDYEYAISIADNPTALVDHYNLLMTGNTLTAQSRQAIIDALATTTVSNDTDRLSRIHGCLLMMACDSAFAVVN